MGVKLVSTSAGSVEVVAPATASNFTATMPAATGNVVLDSAAQTLTNKSWSSPAGSTVSSGTAVASTSGTEIDFTSIPSWVKRITVMFSGVSLSGSDDLLIQIGDSGGFETTGYNSTGGASAGSTQFIVGGSATTTGFLVYNHTGAGASFNFPYVLTNISGNIWVGSYSGNESIRVIAGGGIKTLSDVLTQVRITRTGTNTFDAGSINILYE